MRKTDAALQRDVIAALERESSVQGACIGVAVTDGVVTLSGHVDTQGDKREAECAVQRVAGVKAIAVDIGVTLPGIEERSDTDIAHAAADVLRWTTSVPARGVGIKVEDGWVTLSGMATSAEQRQSATAAVQKLAGVRGVNDRIVLEAGVAVADDSLVN